MSATAPRARSAGTIEVPQPWSVGEAVGVGFTSFLRAPFALMGAYLIPIAVSAAVRSMESAGFTRKCGL